jgi:hypothetical protein
MSKQMDLNRWELMRADENQCCQLKINSENYVSNASQCQYFTTENTNKLIPMTLIIAHGYNW